MLKEQQNLYASFCAKEVDTKCTSPNHTSWNVDLNTKKPKLHYTRICYQGKMYEYVNPDKK